MAKRTLVPVDNVQRVLHPLLFDFFELSGLVFNGFGAGALWEEDEPDVLESPTPLCIWGHIYFQKDGELTALATLALGKCALVRPMPNDVVVGAYLETPLERITWKEYCLLFNIVRGEEEPA